jgi:hypothetical protein
MSTIAESPLEIPSEPNLFRRTKDRFERAMAYTGGITDLGIQTVRRRPRPDRDQDSHRAVRAGRRAFASITRSRRCSRLVLALQTAYRSINSA